MSSNDHGWGVSLRWHGRTIADHRVRGDVILGEAPGCTVVVSGLGPAFRLTAGASLLAVPDLAGTLVTPAGEAAITGPCPLQPGDRAELRLADDLVLELRREAYERLPLATLVNPRELAHQLVVGAALVAGLALLVRVEAPVNTLELRGEPDAEPDSALVRAMFVTAAEAPPIAYHDVYRFEVAPPPTPVPMPIAAVAEVAVPVPLAEVDAPIPKEIRPRRPRGVVKNTREPVMLSALIADEGAFDILAGGVLADDLLTRDVDKRRIEAGVVGIAGQRGVVGPARTVDVEVVDVVEPAAPIEADMGPGAGHDEPVPSDIPVVAPPSGPHSHTEAGADVTRGTADGLAAVAPTDRCDDPTLARKPQLDVVFVVDVSTTMTFMLDRIEKQIAEVDAAARAQALDPRYGLVVFVDDVLVTHGGTAYADLATLQRDLAAWQAFTAGNRQIGSEALNLDWPENTLDAVHAAATRFAWRPADTTLRMIVHATDDDFGEAPAVQSGQTIQHTYREVVDALRAAEVRMFSFAARVGGQCECLDVRAGLFTDFRGRKSLPEATGGAVFDIDAIADGSLGFAAAVGGAIRSSVCARYPLALSADPPRGPR